MATNKEIIEGVYANFTQGDIPAVLAPRSRRVTRDDCSAISSESFRLLPPAAVGDDACRRRARRPPTRRELIGSGPIERWPSRHSVPRVQIAREGHDPCDEGTQRMWCVRSSLGMHAAGGPFVLRALTAAVPRQRELCNPCMVVDSPGTARGEHFVLDRALAGQSVGVVAPALRRPGTGPPVMVERRRTAASGSSPPARRHSSFVLHPSMGMACRLATVPPRCAA